jgi:hypothetical protein
MVKKVFVKGHKRKKKGGKRKVVFIEGYYRKKKESGK